MDIRLKIEGMTCGGCKAAVERVLTGQPGVESVVVDLDGGSARVVAREGTDPGTLASAVDEAGYDARVEG